MEEQHISLYSLKNNDYITYTFNNGRQHIAKIKFVSPNEDCFIEEYSICSKDPFGEDVGEVTYCSDRFNVTQNCKEIRHAKQQEINYLNACIRQDKQVTTGL